MRKLGLQKIAGLTAILATAAALTLVFAGSAFADGSLPWNGVNGATACPAGTTGTMLWIFNPHSDAVPVDLTVDGVTYTGWTLSGNGQNWHLTVPIVGGFPPSSATLTYTGTLGDNPILTISGCNEGELPPATDLSVSKDAAQSHDLEYAWTILKAVDKTEIDVNPGATATFHYTVTVSHDAGTVTNISDVTGNIVVTNPNGGAVTLASISDALSDGTTCTVDTSGNPTLSIPANGTATFPYSCGLSGPPSDAPLTTNTATISWLHQIVDGHDLAAGTMFYTTAVAFTENVTDNCMSASDAFNGGNPVQIGSGCVGDAGDVNGTFTFTYSRQIPAPSTLGTCQSYGNSASFVDNSNPVHGNHSDVSVSVCAFRAPLTIGYWMTHIRQCGAKEKIGTGGCNNNAPFTVQYLPKTLGNFVVSTGATALAIFQANNCGNNAANAQNAVGCLAAQLLATKLDIANGSNPACISATVAAADAFLISINYIGPTGTYTLSATQRATAVSLASALNTYNNNGC
jgi:hypothetical protein